MIALLYLIFFTVYLLISVWVINFAYRFAKRRYQRGWLGGLLAVFVMYNLVFWDWIPVLLMHKYYCETEAGFWVYKTPEEWVKEHPEVIGQDWSDQAQWKTETIDPSYEHKISRSWRSPSIYREIDQQLYVAHAIGRKEEKIVDAETDQILSKAIEFYRGSRGFGGSGTLADLKIWLGAGKRICGSDRDIGYLHEFHNYLKELRVTQKVGEQNDKN